MLLVLQPAGDVRLNAFDGRPGPGAPDNGPNDGSSVRRRWWGRGIGLLLMLPLGLIALLVLALLFGGREGLGGYWIYIVIAVFLVLFVVRISFRRSRRIYWQGQHSGRERPMTILRERYARGEITKEQFDQMSRDLKDRRFR